eukprot:s2967_g6.t1
MTNHGRLEKRECRVTPSPMGGATGLEFLHIDPLEAEVRKRSLGRDGVSDELRSAAQEIQFRLKQRGYEVPSKRSTHSLQGTRRPAQYHLTTTMLAILSSCIKPDADEVLQCIESLYVDKLKPFGRFLRQRVAERHAQIHLQAQHPFVPGQRRLKASLPIETKQIGGVDCEGRDVFSACRLQRFLIFFGGIEGIVGSCCTFGMLQPRTRSCNRTSRRGYQERAQAIQRQSVPFICAGAAALLRHLKGLCDGSDQLDIAPEKGGDWSVTFRGRAQVFVDPDSPVDDFSPRIWEAARAYFNSLPESEALLPGGRYSCAQELVQRELPFLSGFTLGEVCHLVQLAISKHKILGFRHGAVVPYSRSQSRVKEERTESQRPSRVKEERAESQKPSRVKEGRAESQQPCVGAPNKEEPSSRSSLALADLEKAAPGRRQKHIMPRHC